MPALALLCSDEKPGRFKNPAATSKHRRESQERMKSVRDSADGESPSYCDSAWVANGVAGEEVLLFKDGQSVWKNQMTKPWVGKFWGVLPVKETLDTAGRQPALDIMRVFPGRKAFNVGSKNFGPNTFDEHSSLGVFLNISCTRLRCSMSYLRPLFWMYQSILRVVFVFGNWNLCTFACCLFCLIWEYILFGYQLLAPTQCLDCSQHSLAHQKNHTELSALSYCVSGGQCVSPWNWLYDCLPIKGTSEKLSQPEVQYWANPWRRWSKLQAFNLITKICLTSWIQIGSVSDIRLISTY